MSERKINLEEIIQKETDFVSKNNDQVYNIQDIKLCMKEFGTQLLELAAENANYEIDGQEHIEMVWINKQSILDTIKQIE